MMSMIIQFSNIAQNIMVLSKKERIRKNLNQTLLNYGIFQNIMVLIQIDDPFFFKVNIYGLVYDFVLMVVFTYFVIRGTEFSVFFQKDTAAVFGCFVMVEFAIVSWLLWHEIDFEIDLYVSSDYYFVFIFAIRVLNNLWLFFTLFFVGYLKRKSSSTDAEKMDIDLRMTEY